MPLLASASRGLPLLATASRASSSLLAGGGYARLSELDVQHFASIVGAGHSITSPAELEPFNTDWMGKYRGQSALALRPGSTQEVSRILAHCHARRLPVDRKVATRASWAAASPSGRRSCCRSHG